MGSAPSKPRKGFKEDDSDFSSGNSSFDSDYEAYDRENNESVQRHYDALQGLALNVSIKGPRLKEVEIYKELVSTVKQIYEIDRTLSTLTYSKQKNIRIQQGANDIVVRHNTVEAMCEILISCLQFTTNFKAIDPNFTDPSPDSSAPEEDQYLWTIFWYITQYMIEASRISPNFCDRIVKHTFVGVGAQEIHDIGKIHLEEKNFDKTKNEAILECLMRIFYNMARVDKTNDAFDKALRAAGLHEILPPFIHTEHKAVRLASVALLIEIQKDPKKKIKFDTSVDAVKLIVNALDEANKDKKTERSSGGWHGKELTHVLGILSRNSEYKRLLVHDCGCLKVLVQRVKETKKKPKRVTVRVIYSLSFNSDNHAAMVDGPDGVMPLLLELKKSKDKKVRKASIGALWNMRVQMVDSATHKELGKEFFRNAKKPKHPFDKRDSDSDSD